ncbi:MAG: Binding-protein-dependent transport system inner rane component [Gammaproteobacteria bacterium]|nr:Binding-protein-dependent transport system inner rane component [Gammaproteobacteria bacterium]
MKRASTLLLRVGLLLLVWEICGDLRLIADGALPSPSAILLQWWQDREAYPPHIAATMWPASIGFLLGNVIAVAAAVAFVLVPALERLMRGFNIAVFAIPPIAIGPVLVITLPGIWPQIALAAISVYFPTMVMTLLGLRDVDPRPIAVIRSYGGGDLAVLRWLRLRSCLPGMLGGLRVAAPAAILGAILAEFGSGARWGLGSFLLGSLGRGNPARIWGIGLSATAMAAFAYALCAFFARRYTASARATTIAAGVAIETRRLVGWYRLQDLALSVGAIAVPFVIWWAVLAGSGVSPVIARSPLAVWTYLASGPDAADARSAILHALGQSLPWAGIGLLIALSVALGLAVMGVVRRGVTAALMPVSLVLQTMPLVALTPIVVLIFGRGIATTLVVTVAVTFFPAFITIAQGLAQVPKPALDLLDIYGATRIQKLRFVSLPASLPNVCAAARLVAPAALLGVMIAEWLATGYGLGNLLNEARGELDYGMIWAVAFVAIAVSVGFYQFVRLIETRVLSRFQPASGS